MPPKKEKKPRTRRAPAKKKGLRQKQKQRQVVNVQVSAGGSGGGGYIPVPQAPSIDYRLISQLIRPANTVDVPMREMAPIAAPIAVRPAEPESLAEAMPAVSKARKERSDKGKPRAKPEMVSSSTAGMMRSESEYDVPVREAARSSDYYRRTGMIPPGSTDRGKRVSYEEDIFGRSMPKTSDIRASSSFEPPLARKKSSNVRSISDVLSGAESGFETADTETPSKAASRFI
jgi:hypothetical protein